MKCCPITSPNSAHPNIMTKMEKKWLSLSSFSSAVFPIIHEKMGLKMNIMIISMAPKDINAIHGKLACFLSELCLAVNVIIEQIQEHIPLIMEEDTASRPSSEFRSFKSAKRHAMTWKERTEMLQWKLRTCGDWVPLWSCALKGKQRLCLALAAQRKHRSQWPVLFFLIFLPCSNPF